MGHDGNGSKNGTPDAGVPGTRANGVKLESLPASARAHQPMGYITGRYLAALWEERSQQVEDLRQARPDDLKELELRQRQASDALKAYRLLSELERQLGFELALPVLGPRRSSDAAPAGEAPEIID